MSAFTHTGPAGFWKCAGPPTDPKQMKELTAAYDLIETEAQKLFQYDQSQKPSMCRVTLGELQRAPRDRMGRTCERLRKKFAKS